VLLPQRRRLAARLELYRSDLCLGAVISSQLRSLDSQAMATVPVEARHQPLLALCMCPEASQHLMMHRPEPRSIWRSSRDLLLTTLLC